ncbi:MAG: DUF4157 domain-containing protein, partial [Ottowia sp.]|nr:DUF4157 domain-containing protein [Ottowia sp.]
MSAPAHTRVQRAGHAAVPAIAADVLRRAGRPLDARTRAAMEQRFGTDLGDIRLHTDAAAARSAEALSARAYTLGRHIVFGPDAYAPRAPAGRQRLAHEITHAIQQRQPGGADLSTAQREGEARRAAHSVTTGAPMPAISAASPAISRDPVPGTEDDASFQASMAEASCDIGALC